jgi:hypothetical protein
MDDDVGLQPRQLRLEILGIHLVGSQDEHQNGQPDQRRQDDGGWQGRQEHAGRHQPWQAQHVVHTALEQQLPGQVQGHAAEQRRRREGASGLPSPACASTPSMPRAASTMPATIGRCP